METSVQTGMFNSRKEAGILLGELLGKEYRGKSPLVLGIPRGGVEVAYYVAEYLKTELSIIISKKLNFPESPQETYGAVSEEGYAILMKDGKANQDNINKLKEQKLAEVQRRIRVYRDGKPVTGITNRAVILVDEGIITGATMLPVIEYCKSKKPYRIIVAAPVISKDAFAELSTISDEIIFLHSIDLSQGLQHSYQNLNEVEDEKILALLHQAEEIKKEF